MRAPADRAEIRGLSRIAGVGITGLFIALAAILTWPQARYLDSAIGAHDDPLLSIWRLAWVAHQVVRDPVHLFDGNIFHPEPRALAFSDAVIGPALAAAPAFWIGLSPILIYNVLLLAGFVLSGVAMVVLVHRLTWLVAPAVLAGIIFAFAPYRFAHYEHLELQMAFWMPIGLWGAHRLARTGAWRDSAIVAGSVAGQVISSLYYGVFFVTVLVFVLPVLFAGADPRVRWRGSRRLAAACSIAGLVLTPYAIPFVQNRVNVGTRPRFEVERYNATAASFVSAPPRNALYGDRTTDASGGHELHLFPGVVPTVLALAGAWPPFTAVRIACLVGLAVSVDGALGLNGLLYPLLHEYVPLYEGFRAPARFGVLVLLFLSVLAGFGAARLAGPMAGIGRRIAFPILAGIIILIEYWSVPVSLMFLPPKLPAVYMWLAQQPPTVVLELPPARPERLDAIHDGLYMFYSTYHWQPLVNGYSGFFPSSYLGLLERLRTFPDAASIVSLQRRNVELVIVHTSLYEPGRAARLVQELHASADFAFVGRFPQAEGDSLAFRLRDAPSRGEP